MGATEMFRTTPRLRRLNVMLAAAFTAVTVALGIVAGATQASGQQRAIFGALIAAIVAISALGAVGTSHWAFTQCGPDGITTRAWFSATFIVWPLVRDIRRESVRGTASAFVTTTSGQRIRLGALTNRGNPQFDQELGRIKARWRAAAAVGGGWPPSPGTEASPAGG